jgi:hypothetical protein
VTGKSVALFSPREYAWTDHFAWDDDQTHIVPLTEIGRVTVDLLAMNGALIVAARALWRRAGLHPAEP